MIRFVILTKRQPYEQNAAFNVDEIETVFHSTEPLKEGERPWSVVTLKSGRSYQIAESLSAILNAIVVVQE